MIDTQAIRNKILDLAISGKLTDQLPKDGTAEELYRQIQEERKTQESTGIIKTVELAPDVPATEIPFAIPSNWKWTKLGNVSYIVRGGSPRPIKQYITTREDGINWIKIGDVERGGKYISSTHEKIIPEGEAKSRHVYPGDFLLTNSMSFGRPYISQIEGCIHDGWLLIHNLRGFVPDYLYYLLSSAYLYGQFTIKASGSTVNNLNIDKVKEAIIPLPPLAEQHRIVEKIEQTFSLLDTIEALQSQYADNLTVLKTKLMDAAIQGKLTDQLPEDGTAEDLYRQIQAQKQALSQAGKIKKEKPLPEISADEIPFDLPNNWCWCRLNSVYNFIDYRGVTPNKISEGVPFVTAKNVRQGYIDYSISEFISEEDYQKRQARGISHKGDILFTTEAPMGYAAIANLDRFSAGQRLITLQQYTANPLLENKYYVYAILAPFFQKQLDAKCSGTTVKGIKADRLKQFLIPLPPLAEQKRIVAKLEEILPLCARPKRELS